MQNIELILGVAVVTIYVYFRDQSSSLTDIKYKGGNMNRGEERATNEDDS